LRGRQRRKEKNGCDHKATEGMSHRRLNSPRYKVVRFASVAVAHRFAMEQ
jgi:hypothetical protein